METNQLLDIIVGTAQDSKALDLVIFDMEGRSAVCDYLVICHGTSRAHTQGIADPIMITLKNQSVQPLGVEGMEEGRWILIDYNTVIVHIFLEEVRQLYQIEEIYQTFPKRDA